MNFLTLFKNIYKDYSLQLFIFSFILLFSGVMEILGLVLLAPILDIIIGNELSENSFITKKIFDILEYLNLDTGLDVLFLLFIFFTIFSSALSTCGIYFSEKIKFSYGYDLMKSTLNSLLSLKWIFFTKTKQGSLLNVLNRELRVVISTLSICARMLSGTVQLILIGTLLFSISWKLVLSVFLILALSFYPLGHIGFYAKKIGTKDTLSSKIFLTSLQEMISGLKVIIGNSMQIIVRNEVLMKYSRHLKIAVIRAVFFQGINNAIYPLMAIGFAFLYYFSTYFFQVGITEMGVLSVAFIRMASKLGQIVKEKSQLETCLASLNELNLIGRKNTKFKVKNGKNIFQNFKSKIQLKNISYSYDKNNLILNRCSLDFEKGKIIGIAGESGSGKSTIVDLLMGFDFPQKGKITVDGVQIQDLNLDHYRKKIAYVSQDTVLFHTSILKNILWANSNINKKNIDKIISSSKAFSFINKLPRGLQTIVGDRGTSLSGGQIQRISLLRAIIKDPEIIILDEGTSALDEKNENHVMNFLYNLKKSKTIIIVSHRINTLKKVDKLYILKNGSVLQKRGSGNLVSSNKKLFTKILNSKK